MLTHVNGLVVGPGFLDPYVAIARTRPSVTAQAALSAGPRDPLVFISPNLKLTVGG
jgi:hypothetical protein